MLQLPSLPIPDGLHDIAQELLDERLAELVRQAFEKVCEQVD